MSTENIVNKMNLQESSSDDDIQNTRIKKVIEEVLKKQSENIKSNNKNMEKLINDIPETFRVMKNILETLSLMKQEHQDLEKRLKVKEEMVNELNNRINNIEDKLNYFFNDDSKAALNKKEKKWQIKMIDELKFKELMNDPETSSINPSHIPRFIYYSETHPIKAGVIELFFWDTNENHFDSKLLYPDKEAFNDYIEALIEMGGKKDTFYYIVSLSQ